MNRNYFLLLMLMFCVFAFSVNAEEEAKCATCGGDGKIVDTECPNKYPYLSTYAYNKYKSHGFGFLVCPKCFGSQTEWDTLDREYNTWLDGRREKIDYWIFGSKGAKFDIGHVEGEHFIVSGTIRAGTDWVGKKTKKMTAGERAENYIRMCEEIYEEHLIKFLGLKKYAPREKFELTIWSGGGQIERASNRLVGNTQTCISTFQGRLLTIPDSTGRSHFQSIIFNLFFLCIQEYKQFVVGGLPDWFWEGYAHYVENAVFHNVANNMADEAAGSGGGLSGTNFRKKLKRMAKSGKYPDIADFGNSNVSQLSYKDRLMAWGLIDWIHTAYGGKKLELFVKILKRTKSQGSAFKDAIGINFSEVCDEYMKWAKENY